MKRRQFIKSAGAAFSVPFMLNGVGITALSGPLFFNFDTIDAESDRVLVLIQLNGGNDGLNTIIPMDQYSNLYKARPNVIIPESKILRTTETLGMHPAMTGIKALFDDGRMEIVQNVSYPNPNRSHFRSMEIWNTGSPSNEVWSTGWLGRYFDQEYPGFPDNYPNDQYADPFAIATGYFVSETCQGMAANFSVAINDPFGLKPIPDAEGDGQYSSHFREELAFVKSMFVQTNGYTDRVSNAAGRGRNLGSYPDTDLGAQMKNIALLIDGGLKTKVYVANLGGFDTHAAQVGQGNPLAGRHAVLMQTLSDAIKAFQDDLKKLGLEERVVGMTFSEFGRQIRSNGSNGTDHGEAAPLLLFGHCVNAQILGHNPQISSNVEVQAAVPMEYDFRDIYGTLLQDWFGVPQEIVKKLLKLDFQHLPILSGCGVATATKEEEAITAEKIYNYPNPFTDWTTIYFSSMDEWVRLGIFDAMGSEVKTLVDSRLNAGEHQIRFEGRSLPAGNYYFRLRTSEQQHTGKMIKIL